MLSLYIWIQSWISKYIIYNKRLNIGSKLLLSEIFSNQLHSLDYSVNSDNITLRTPSLFAINVIITHIFIINSFKMYTSSLSQKVTIRGIFPLLIHLKIILIHVQQIYKVIESKEFENFVYSILFTKVIFVIVYWIVILSIYFYLEYYYFSNSKIKLIIKRKYFHHSSNFS